MLLAPILFAALLNAPAISAAPASPAVLEEAALEPALPSGLDVQDRPFPLLHYARFPASPSAKPLTWDSVIQGQLGSCFFLSTLAALAQTRPSLVANAVRPTTDGAYVVRLFGPRGRSTQVAVDDRFPATGAGDPFFARGPEAGEIRPALFEKAYAKLSGGYEAINGGDAADAFAALTGRAGREVTLTGQPVERVWRLVSSARRARRPIVASTYEEADMRRLTGRDDLGGLIDDHVYAVLDVYLEDGRRLVRLYTPLTPADAGYGRDGSRLVVLPVERFARLFDAVTIGR